MTLFHEITFDQIVLAFLTCFVIREMMIFVLPDAIAGPGGWLVDTDADAGLEN